MTSRTAQLDPNRDTYYQLLGVDFRATTADITKAYRQLMMECHPDRVPASKREETEQFCKFVNHAYATLKDPIKRKQYDDTIRAQEIQDQIMNRYVGGLGGPGLGGHDLHGSRLRREMTDFERAEARMTNRTAMFSLFRAFVVLTVFAIGLLLLFAILSSAATLLPG